MATNDRAKYFFKITLFSVAVESDLNKIISKQVSNRGIYLRLRYVFYLEIYW